MSFHSREGVRWYGNMIWNFAEFNAKTETFVLKKEIYCCNKGGKGKAFN